MAQVSLTQMRDALRVLKDCGAPRRCGLSSSQADLVEAHLQATIAMLDWMLPRAARLRGLLSRVASQRQAA